MTAGMWRKERGEWKYVALPASNEHPDGLQNRGISVSRTSGAAYPQKDLKTFDTHTQTQVNSPRAQITHPHMNIFA